MKQYLNSQGIAKGVFYPKLGQKLLRITQNFHHDRVQVPPIHEIKIKTRNQTEQIYKSTLLFD